MAKVDDPRKYWNGLCNVTDRMNVLRNAGADPARWDDQYDDLPAADRELVRSYLAGERPRTLDRGRPVEQEEDLG